MKYHGPVFNIPLNFIENVDQFQDYWMREQECHIVKKEGVMNIFGIYRVLLWLVCFTNDI